MPRGFGATSGASTNDLITARLIAQTNNFSFSGWFFANTAGATSRGRFYDWVAGTALNFNAASNSMAFAYAFSITSPVFTFVPPALSGWHHLLVSYDASNVANVPVIYIDGVSTAVTVATAPVGTITTTPTTLLIGNRAALDRCWDGFLAHFACWKISIGANNAMALANGANPILIRPDSLSLYMPLDGVNNPEIDLINGNSSAISGTRLGKNEPPVRVLPNAYAPLIDSALGSLITGSIVGAQPPDYAIIAAAESITATLAGYQQPDFAAISANEVFSAALVAYQQTDYANISVAQLVAAAIAAWQQTDYGNLTVNEVVSIALNAYQQVDFASISATETISAVIQALQQVDYGALVETEIIQAIIAAYQVADFGLIIVPKNAQRVRARVSAVQVYSASLQARKAYNAVTTISAPL